MIDMHQLPNAWDTFNELRDEESIGNEGLYDIYYDISTAIFEYRRKKNLTQKKLADKLGVTQAMISKLESGDYNYSIEQLWKISIKLGIKLDISFGEEPEEVAVGKEDGDQQIDLNYYQMAVGS